MPGSGLTDGGGADDGATRGDVLSMPAVVSATGAVAGRRTAQAYPIVLSSAAATTAPSSHDRTGPPPNRDTSQSLTREAGLHNITPRDIASRHREEF